MCIIRRRSLIGVYFGGVTYGRGLRCVGADFLRLHIFNLRLFRRQWLLFQFLFNRHIIYNMCGLLFALIQLYVQVERKGHFQCAAHIVTYAIYAAAMFIDISRLSVWVGVEFGIRADNMLGIVDEIAVGADTCTCIFFSYYKGFFQLAQSFLRGIFLQHNDIAAHLGVGRIGECVVGQTQCAE